jgi:outer membrane receptor protein involved in Fe transport
MTSPTRTTFTFGKMWQESAVPVGTTVTTKNYFVNATLEGKLFGDYKWDVAYSRGQAKEKTINNNSLDNGRLYAALDAVVNPANGQIVCNVTLTNPGLYPGCVPLNVFGPSSEDPAAVDYIIVPTATYGTSTMDDVSGSLTGAPFNSWAGPVNLALSGDMRRLGYELRSEQLPPSLDPLSCVGLRFNCAANGTTAKRTTTAANRSPVSMDIGEAALELNLPIIKDLGFIPSADFNGAVRYAHYSSEGSTSTTVPSATHTFSATTWKAGLDVHLGDRVRFRATRSRDFRAPNLNELYMPATLDMTNAVDRLTGAAVGLLPRETSGTPTLQPEVGNTWTAGIVVTPTDAFSVAVDAFHIVVSNAILQVNGPQNNLQDACYASGGASFYCTLQDRPLGYTNKTTANNLTKWYRKYLNIAELRTWGADIDASYRMTAAGQPLTLRALATYQPHVIYEQPGLETLDMGGVAFADGGIQATAVWRVVLDATYQPIDSLGITWETRWRSALQHASAPSQIYAPGSTGVPSVAFSNLTVTYHVPVETLKQLDLYGTVQNVFNQMPPLTAFPGQQPNPGQFGGFALGDDYIGRYYTAGLRFEF